MTILRFFKIKPKKTDIVKCFLCKGNVDSKYAGDVHQSCLNEIFGADKYSLPVETKVYYENEINQLQTRILDIEATKNQIRDRLTRELSELKVDMAIKDETINELRYKIESYHFLDNWNDVKHELIAKDIIGFLHLRGIDINLAHSQISFSRNNVESNLIITLTSVRQERVIIVRIQQGFGNPT